MLHVLQGETKVSETFWRAVVAIYRVLVSFYGTVRVDFSQPFSVKVCNDGHCLRQFSVMRHVLQNQGTFLIIFFCVTQCDAASLKGVTSFPGWGSYELEGEPAYERSIRQSQFCRPSPKRPVVVHYNTKPGNEVGLIDTHLALKCRPTTSSPLLGRRTSANPVNPAYKTGKKNRTFSRCCYLLTTATMRDVQYSFAAVRIGIHESVQVLSVRDWHPVIGQQHICIVWQPGVAVSDRQFGVGKPWWCRWQLHRCVNIWRSAQDGPLPCRTRRPRYLLYSVSLGKVGKWDNPGELRLVGGVAQWLGRRSLAGGLSRIYAWSMGQPCMPTQPSIPSRSVNE